MRKIFCIFNNRIFNSWIIVHILRKQFFYMILLFSSYKINAVIDLFKCICNVAFGIITTHTGVN